jgi:hypothetical protein
VIESIGDHAIPESTPVTVSPQTETSVRNAGLSPRATVARARRPRARTRRSSVEAALVDRAAIPVAPVVIFLWTPNPQRFSAPVVIAISTSMSGYRRHYGLPASSSSF